MRKNTMNARNRNLERRLANDRRNQDQGPPQGWNERRRSVERRLPEVAEDVVSHEVWEEYFAGYVAKLAAKAEEVQALAAEQANPDPGPQTA